MSIGLIELLKLSTLTLSTTSPEGWPNAAPLYFAASFRFYTGQIGLENLRDLALYFFSEENSQHILDIRSDPRAAAVIYPESRTWQEIRGLQMRGEVRLVPQGQEWERAWELYQVKFPFFADLRTMVARNRLYVFMVDWVRIVDYHSGLGAKEEWQRASENV